MQQKANYSHVRLQELSLTKHTSMLCQRDSGTIGCPNPPNNRSKSVGLLKARRFNKVKRLRKDVIDTNVLKSHLESHYLAKRAMLSGMSPVSPHVALCSTKRKGKSPKEFVSLQNSSKQSTFPCFSDSSVIRNPELMVGCLTFQEVDNDKDSTSSEISKGIARQLASLTDSSARYAPNRQRQRQ